jgi:hypothetical protein
MTTQPVYIVDIVGEVVQKAQAGILATIQANETSILGATSIQAINYQFGPFEELIETLAQYDTDLSLRYQKYPLVYLVTDFTEQRGRLPGVYADTRLNIAICHQTSATYKSIERKEKVFEPVLYPIYLRFMEELSKHPMTMPGSDDMIQHDKTDRYYWGTRELGTSKNKLADYVDAIEIQNLQLKFDYQPCFP